MIEAIFIDKVKKGLIELWIIIIVFLWLHPGLVEIMFYNGFRITMKTICMSNFAKLVSSHPISQKEWVKR